MMKNKEENKNSFVGHLAELRSRLIKSFVFLLLAFVVSYYFSEEIYSFLVKPYSDEVLNNNLNRKLIFTALHETFITYLISTSTGKVSSFCAKYKYTLVTNAPPSSVTNTVCASGSYHCSLLTVVLNVSDVVSSTLS